MKIIAQIPTGKITGPGWFQETTELVAVEVVAVMRYSCGPGRYYYHAQVKAPDCILPGAIGLEPDGTILVNVIRKVNPKWKPPVFPEGKNRVLV